MGTAKRERQKVNRQIRLQELAKEARKEKSKKLATYVTLGVVAFVAIVALIAFVGGKDTSPTTAASTTTVDPNAPTTTTAPKPTVSIPTSIPTKLGITTLIDGKGTGAKAGDTITVNYVGVLSADGTEFDNSYDRGQSFPFTLGQGAVIKGWDQGLLGAKVGSRVQLDIPADLAYGSQGKAGIKPDSALTFVIDVLAITPG